jgi:prevent-host-death family protein
MTIKTIKSGEARIKWRNVLDQVFAGKGDVVIERSGKKIAVLIPAADYEQIHEALDELRAVREAAAAYDEWKRNPSSARPFDEVDAELDAGGTANG